MASILTATFTELDGSVITGPITKNKNGTFLFRNTNSASDLYFLVQKFNDGWHFAGGPSTYTIPQQFIDAVGQVIDEYYR